MIYAQFYHLGVISKTPIEACGDRSVIILDGRNSSATWHEIAARECAKRGYIGWRLFRGETFTRSRAVSSYHESNRAHDVRLNATKKETRQ